MKKRTFKNIKLYIKNYILKNKHMLLFTMVISIIIYLGIIFTW